MSETYDPNSQIYDPKTKKRTFVRAVEGDYGLNAELKRLRSMPRVLKGKERKFDQGPQEFNKHYMHPADGIGQTLHIHMKEYSPGGVSHKHGHANEACFYILDGEGFEIHDEVRYDWKAGDLAIVPSNCVHQHNNGSKKNPVRALVLKTKPTYLFMNLLFQKTVIPTPKVPSPEGIGYVPREEGDK